MAKHFCEKCNRVIKKREGSWCVLCKARLLATMTPKARKQIKENLKKKVEAENNK